MAGMLVQIPVSVGELFDKITILRTKAARISGADKLANVVTELNHLSAVADGLDLGDGVDALVAELQQVNEALWDIEDGKRACERDARFDDAFIALARRVYIDNDRRAAIKREINRLTGSAIVEEKSYG